MNKTKLASIFSMIALLCLACGTDQGQRGPIQSTTSLIREGRSPRSQAPIHHSAIRIDGYFTNRKSFICSGTVLSKNVVLTAAHCVTEYQTEEVRRLLPVSLLSVNNAFAFWGGSIDVEKVLVPNEYLHASSLRDLGYDIALIKLKSDLPSEYVPAMVATDFASAMRKDLFSAGFGVTDPETSSDQQDFVGNLAVGRISIDLNDRIEETTTVSPANRDFSNLLKLDVLKSEVLLCKGDSGGPVYFEENGKVVVLGVHSAMGFKKKVDARKVLCSDRNSSEEYVASVFSENRYFIEQGFESLTGMPLPGAKKHGSKTQDPSTIDYYLESRGSVPIKNEWIDLSGLNASVLNGKLVIFPDISSQRGCLILSDSLSRYFSSVDFLELDGVDVATVALGKLAPTNLQIDLRAMFSSRELDFDKLYRGKIKLFANSIMLVVQTPSGFVRANLPLSECLTDGFRTIRSR